MASLDSLYDMSKKKGTFADDFSSRRYLDLLERSITDKAYSKGDWSRLKDALGVVADNEFYTSKVNDKFSASVAYQLTQMRKLIEVAAPSSH